MIYSKLLDRIYGEDDESVFKNGGWMTSSTGYVSAVRRSSFKQPFASVVSTPSLPTTNKDHLTNAGAALVKLLAAREGEEGSIFSLLWAMDHPVELALDIKMLPAPTQLEMTTRSTNIPVLYTHLLHKPLARQVLDPRTPAIMLTMAEYFLFYFLRYPVSRTRQSTPSWATSSAPRRAWSTFRNTGILQLTSGSPYACILLQYLEFFLPNSGLKPKPQSFLASPSGRHYAKIFLHMLVELWLHQNSVMDTIQGNMPLSMSPTHHQSRQPPPPMPKPTTRMPSATLPVHTMGEYIEPTTDTLSSLLLAVIYFLNDPVLPIPMPSDISLTAQTVSGLTESLIVLQSRLFQFFQIVVSRCQIRVSPTTFFSVVDVWLAIAQPWKCRESYLQGDSSTRTKTAAVYTSEWEPYVLSNYHMYTSLMCLLLKRLGELDYTGKDGEAHLRVVFRVLNVYNSTLLDSLDIATELLEDMQQKGSFETEPEPEGKTRVLYHLIRNHCFTLNVMVEPIRLKSYRRDAERLAEQIRWVLTTKCSEAARKTAKDILTLLCDIFEIADVKTDTFSVGQHGLSKRTVVAVPKGPDRDKKKNFALTENGRQQVRAGLRMCSPDDVSYTGDPMLQPVRSFEFEFLVYVTIWISRRLNQSLNLGRGYEDWQKQRESAYLRRTKMGDVDFTTAPPLQFRFNLRFFALKIVVYTMLVFLVPSLLVFIMK